MTKAIRAMLFVVVIVQFILAIAFFFQMPFAVNLWPYEGTTPLSFMFISSIFAAAAASTLWAVSSETYGALAGIGLDYIVILLPVSIFSFQLGASTGNAGLTTYGIACVFGVLFGLALILWSIRIPMPTLPRMPGVVRWSFVVFIIALFFVAGRLVLQVPNTIPWKITTEFSVVMGWIFFGAAAYFIYGLVRPSWANSAGQLCGFLAYDLVLIVPFLQRLPTVPAEQKLGMYIYTAVVIYSGLLAIYFLFIHKTTRLWHPGRQPAGSEALQGQS